MPPKKTFLNEQELARTLETLSLQIIKKHGSQENLVLIGIQRRGADLAGRLQHLLENKLGRTIPLGLLDINLYRDDWTSPGVQPQLNKTDIAFAIEDAAVILVDDVLFTGRTVRAALEAVLDFGRPCQVKLLVLVDRGHRELPIAADYAGITVETQKGEHVDVLLTERDGCDAVVLAGQGLASGGRQPSPLPP